jgi:hypothetical protein
MTWLQPDRTNFRLQMNQTLHKSRRVGTGLSAGSHKVIRQRFSPYKKTATD